MPRPHGTLIYGRTDFANLSNAAPAYAGDPINGDNSGRLLTDGIKRNYRDPRGPQWWSEYEIDYADLHLDAGYVRCWGKGDKERVVPLGGEADATLRRYIEEAWPKLTRGPGTETLFVNARGGPLTRQGFWKIVKHAALTAGISQKITPHTFPTLFCQSPPGARRRSEICASDVRSCGYQHHADLYPCCPGKTKGRPHAVSSTRVTF